MSPGVMQIAGNYTQTTFGTLQIELGGLSQGNNYDQLLVSGSATHGGTLNVLLINGFTPSLGDSFDILDWGTLSGTFSTLQLPALDGSLGWDTSQLYTTGTLAVTTVPEPASLLLLAMTAPWWLRAARRFARAVEAGS